MNGLKIDVSVPRLTVEQQLAERCDTRKILTASINKDNHAQIFVSDAFERHELVQIVETLKEVLRHPLPTDKK